MLSEYEGAKQVRGEPFRRWFADDDMDLIVWYQDDRATPLGFQLCYEGDDGDRRAFTWTEDGGYSHLRIDEGERAGRPKMTPLLVLDGAFSGDIVAGEFSNRSGELAAPLTQLVLAKIRDYQQRRN